MSDIFIRETKLFETMSISHNNNNFVDDINNYNSIPVTVDEVEKPSYDRLGMVAPRHSSIPNFFILDRVYCP